MALRVLLTVVLFAALATAAGATYPPRFCGQVKAHHHKYDIKADFKCKTARSDIKQFMKGRGTPKGFKCFHYKDSAQEYRCERGETKTVFANRR